MGEARSEGWEKPNEMKLELFSCSFFGNLSKSENKEFSHLS